MKRLLLIANSRGPISRDPGQQEDEQKIDKWDIEIYLHRQS